MVVSTSSLFPRRYYFSVCTLFLATSDIRDIILAEFALCYLYHVMDEGYENDDRMDVEWTRDAASHATPLGSPSYSPPGLEARIEGKGAEEGGHGHDEADEGDDEEAEEEKTARCKAKGKAKAKTSPTTLVLTLDIDTYTNRHRPRLVLSSHPTEAHHSAPDSIHEKHFADADADADADAAMNDALPPPPSSSSHPPSSYPPTTKHHNPSENAPPPPPPRNFATQPAFSAELMTKLMALQRSPQPYQRHRGDGGRGRGWGRGRGRGLGGELRWRGTMTREKIESEGWGACDEADAASMDGGEMGWGGDGVGGL